MKLFSQNNIKKQIKIKLKIFKNMNTWTKILSNYIIYISKIFIPIKKSSNINLMAKIII